MTVRTLLLILLIGTLVFAAWNRSLLVLAMAAIPPALAGYLVRTEGSFGLKSKRARVVAGILILIASLLIIALAVVPRPSAYGVAQLILVYFSSCLVVALQSKFALPREER